MRNKLTTSAKLGALRTALLEETYDQQDIFRCIVGIGNRFDFRSNTVQTKGTVFHDTRYDSKSAAVSAFVRKFGVTHADATMLYDGQFSHGSGYNVRAARRILMKLVNKYWTGA